MHKRNIMNFYKEARFLYVPIDLLFILVNTECLTMTEKRMSPDLSENYKRVIKAIRFRIFRKIFEMWTVKIAKCLGE